MYAPGIHDIGTHVVISELNKKQKNLHVDIF